MPASAQLHAIRPERKKQQAACFPQQRAQSVLQLQLSLQADGGGVQVAVLRTMLTFVTSVTISMHAMVLLLVIRGCYNIFIMSRNDLNQQAAKAVLTQIVNVVFQRLVVGEGGQVRPITPPDLVAVSSARAEARRDAATAQQVIMSVWESVMPADAPISSFTEDVYNMPESDSRSALLAPGPRAHKRLMHSYSCIYVYKPQCTCTSSLYRAVLCNLTGLTHWMRGRSVPLCPAGLKSRRCRETGRRQRRRSSWLKSPQTGQAVQTAPSTGRRPQGLCRRSRRRRPPRRGARQRRRRGCCRAQARRCALCASYQCARPTCRGTRR